MSTHKATGLIIREGTDDNRAYSEVKDYVLVNPKDKAVVDIGAHVGFSVNWFLEQGAKGVYAFEADPETFKILETNFGKNERCAIFNEAVIGSQEPEITFYRKKNTRDGTIHAPAHGGVQTTPITVKARNFREILAITSPDVLKIDCEGSEYTFDFLNLPDSVKYIAMELHLGRKVWIERAKEITKEIEEQGFSVLKAPKFDEMFATVGVWKRENLSDS